MATHAVALALAIGALGYTATRVGRHLRSPCADWNVARDRHEVARLWREADMTELSRQLDDLTIRSATTGELGTLQRAQADAKQRLARLQRLADELAERDKVVTDLANCDRLPE